MSARRQSTRRPARPERSPAAILELLARGRWFGGLRPALQHAIVERGVLRQYAADEFIIRAGDPSKGMFAVLDGRVRLLVHAADGDETVIHVGESGFWFGVYALMAGEPSNGSVVAATPVRALLLSPGQFEAICAQDPRNYRDINRYMLSMFDYLFRYLGEAQALAREEWLALRLADLAAMRRADQPADGPVTLHIRQSELATMIGTSRQTVSGMLARLEARGLVAVRYRSLLVVDEPGLRAAARRPRDAEA